MSIEERLPIALLKAMSIQKTQMSNRAGVYHAGYFAEFKDGGRIDVSTLQRVATEHETYGLDALGDIEIFHRFVRTSKFEDVTVRSLRFPGDRRDTYSPTDEEVADFLSIYA